MTMQHGTLVSTVTSQTEKKNVYYFLCGVCMFMLKKTEEEET